MDCKVSEKIIDFHFGKLSTQSRSQVETHLAQCPACLAEYFALKRDLEIPGAALPAPLVSRSIKEEFEAFCQSIWSQESRNWVRENKRSLLISSVLAAAAVLFLLLSSQKVFKGPEKEAVYDHELLRKLDEAI